MAEFYVSLSQSEMAEQMACMVNKHNNLRRKRTKHTMLKDQADYFIEVVRNKVIGFAGLAKQDTNLCEIKHVCVDPEFRKRGIASKLVKLAIANCPTDYVYMVISEENIPSLTMAKSLGFVMVKKQWGRGHHVIIVGRNKAHGSTSRKSEVCSS